METELFAIWTQIGASIPYDDKQIVPQAAPIFQ